MKRIIKQSLVVLLTIAMCSSMLSSTAMAMELEPIADIPISASEDKKVEVEASKTEIIEEVVEEKGVETQNDPITTEEYEEISVELENQLEKDADTEQVEEINEDMPTTLASATVIKASDVVSYLNSKIGTTGYSGLCLKFVADSFAALGATRSSEIGRAHV